MPIAYQPGIRAAIAFAILVMVVPFVALAVQAMRTGTAARERRYAALSLAGATAAQLRSVAAREGRRAAVRAGLSVGPAYLVGWLLLGRLPAQAYRLLPEPDVLTPLAWLGLVVLLGLAGGASAVVVSGAARVTPLGISRRVPRQLGPRDAVLPVAAALAIGLLTWSLSHVARALSSTELIGVVLAVIAADLVLGITLGPWLIRAVGGLGLRGGLVSSQTSRRLLADVRTSGRVAGVLFIVGGALTLLLDTLLWFPLLSGAGYHLSFGPEAQVITAAILGTVLMTGVVCGSLVVGATEQVLDGRRAIAALVALAASPDLMVRVVRRQLMLAAGPPAALGALMVSFSPLWYSGTSPGQIALQVLDATLVGILTAAAAALAARAVRPAVYEAARPENLRAA